MLAKILEDMWVEPEVLEALSEEQKRILFLKMRQEQVRRWREREEREEREGRDTRPKKAYSKHVSWLLGRDGDVSVSVIGEVDEFRSSKLLQSLMNNRVRSDDMNCIQREDVLPGREAQQLSCKEDIQLVLTDDAPASPNDPSSEKDSDSCSIEDQTQDSDSESGSSSDNQGEWTILYRPHFRSPGSQPPTDDPTDTVMRSEKDKEILRCEEKKSAYGGRVAQLRKAFADDLHSSPPAYTKPPLPAKPAHLQNRSTPVRH
ncbi:uncharacterized protein LOC141793263 isoform X2 [Halichoeres trimaculatus]|uniref:uncharacterized protein LOC141793263 isoform X2 n=1 Tax=Halichoeres trimaculatus TaxID=147232 RepID=UPI003D9DBF00